MSRCSLGACVDSSPGSLSGTVTNEGIEDDEEEEDGGRVLPCERAGDSSRNRLWLSGELGWSREDILVMGEGQSRCCVQVMNMHGIYDQRFRIPTAYTGLTNG